MTAVSETEKRPGIIRRLYHWTISWADRPGGTWALFLIAFAESSFFPIPPDVLLLALCFGARKKWAKYALVCTAGSVLGGIAGWLIGWGLAESVAQPLLNFFDGDGHTQEKIQTWYADYGFLGILIAAITPIPYKVFTIASGLFHYSLPQLIIASIIGRGFRFFVVAGIIRIFGPKVRPFIEKHLEWCFLGLGALVVIGILAIKFLH
ncbi:SNARE-associated domain containing protein YqaA [Haloferula helveola]|uniref:SNARE-associated domain containing protein YqaA n=1 Tax=Haloferula helveola TaxID=490095 RepID=A0ABN6H954_9BACT|nr:SNARE-associated domain containing protein YqaA [Haloferula helveola]